MVSTKRRLSPSQKISKGATYGFLLLLSSVAVLNAQPYIVASSNLFGEVVVIPGVDLLSRLPGVAPILALLGVLLPPLLGVIVWALLQVLQCIPLFMADPQMLLKRIEAAQMWCQLNLGTTQVDWVNELIQRFMRFPVELQRGLIKAAASSYLVDALIGAWHYPPLNVPIQSFKQVWGYFTQLLTGDFDFALVDWGSVAKLAVMLFAFEGIIAIALFVRQVGLYLLGVSDDRQN
jgi:hypothetical protein